MNLEKEKQISQTVGYGDSEQVYPITCSITNPAEEIFRKITNVTIKKTVPSEPDILEVHVGDGYFEINSAEVINFEIFIQKWFKVTHCILPSISEEKWIVLWKKIIDEKAIIIEAKEVSEPVFIAKLLIEHMIDSTTKIIPVSDNTLLQQDGLTHVSLPEVSKWLRESGFNIKLSELSKALVELGVKAEGVRIIPHFDDFENRMRKSIFWAFYIEALEESESWNGD